jgi:5-(carboxyamino)imidazole ribonucleotide synthase
LLQIFCPDFSTDINSAYKGLNITNKFRIFVLQATKLARFMVKVGILGGGQLGRMLLQASANYQVEVHVMENDPECPAAMLTSNFKLGDIRNFDDVVSFGSTLDALTIEIENVNTAALYALVEMGVKVIPHPDALQTIKNKITQKQYYTAHDIKTADYLITNTLAEIETHAHFLPAVQKLATGGYDGKGVQILRTLADLQKGFDAPAVLEKMVDIDKEIAVTIAVGADGQQIAYPPVEMIFDPELNLLDLQVCPAAISASAAENAVALAMMVARNFKSAGLFAVEMFVDKAGDVWVNETAPRVHNSGHHSIEAHYSSQFDMLWRIILGYPLGNTAMIMPSVMLNILGAPGYKGLAVEENLDKVLAMPDVFLHLYGKRETKPGRKMGHATIIGQDVPEMLEKASLIKNTFAIIGNETL